MIIGINKLYQIKQVRDITDTLLTVVELDELSEDYPFKDCSDSKILCYCYKQTENGTSIYPYIPTNIIEKIEADNTKIKELNTQITTTQEAVDFLIMGGTI